MEIKVIGEGCDKCDRLYENTKAAVAQLGLDVEVEKVQNLLDIVRLGVLTAPALLVDGKLFFAGRVATAAEIVRVLQR